MAPLQGETLVWASAKNISQETLLAIFDSYAPVLYRYAFILHDNAVIADEIVGEVFTRLSEDIVSDRVSRVNLRSYLYETAYHLLVDETLFSDHPVRVDKVRLRSGDRRLAQLSFEDRRSLETIQLAFRNHLTVDQRHVILLRLMAGLSLKETAAILGKTVGNVKVIQNRAIAALRKALGYQYEETRRITVLVLKLMNP